MITLRQLTPVGKFLKPHGVSGEIGVLREPGTFEFDDLSCIIVEIDGIFVPFFLESVRQKGAETDLLKIEGIDTSDAAAQMTNRTVYALRKELIDRDSEDGEEDGFFADDFIGFKVLTTDNEELGIIDGIDSSTENYLFQVKTPSGAQMLIPVAEQFISAIDTDNRILVLDLPVGLTNL